MLQHLRNILKYHQISGIENYPLSAAVEKLLSFTPRAECDAATGQAQKDDSPMVVSPQPAAAPAVDPRDGTIEEIASEIRGCRSCSLIKRRIVPVCGRGGRNVKLFVVGGWLLLPETGKREAPDCPEFGAEEDMMLSRMFSAIHLQPGETFVANVIKCGIGEDTQPKAEHVDACVSYLHRQIAAVSPEVICTMGILATRTLLKKSLPLSQLRGKMYRYPVSGEKTVPLIATYHPSFLLKNPEMKHATWQDLQRIEKELKGGEGKITPKR